MWDYQVLKNWAYSRKTFVLVSVPRGGRERGGGRREEGGRREGEGGRRGRDYDLASLRDSCLTI